jgi:hypothetical protein
MQQYDDTYIVGSRERLVNTVFYFFLFFLTCEVYARDAAGSSRSK